MGKKVANYNEVLGLLKQGEEIIYLGGIEPSACIRPKDKRQLQVTVRLDTLYKLSEQGLVTDFGYPKLHAIVKLKETARNES